MECDVCGSEELTLLGVLGQTAHARCRSCGLDHLTDVELIDDIEESEHAQS